MEHIDDIINYQPSDYAVELLEKIKVVIFAGISSAGKNTIMNELIKTDDFFHLVTSTTRAPRINDGAMEIEGVDYHFLSIEQALENARNRRYVEVSLVHEHINGLLVDEIEKTHKKDKIAITDVDTQGVDIYKKLSQSVIAIFILPPSYEEWLRRMQYRYESQDVLSKAWPVRKSSAIQELQLALEVPYYHFVINNDVNESVEACLKIIREGDSLKNKNDEARLLARDILDQIKSNS